MKIKRLIPVLFVILISLSACAAKASEMASDVQSYAAPSMDSGVSYEKDYSYNTIEAESTSSDRVVIKNASMKIIVDDTVAILEQIQQMAENSGGFVVSSNLYKVTTDQGLEVPGAEITVRVPAEQLEDIMKQIETLLVDPDKDIQYENVSGEDVTAQYTDLQSRLRNLEDAQEQLQKIMDEAYTTEDVLAVYNQLTSVNEQIEVLRGQIKYYEEASSLSSLQVSIIAREGVQEITIGGWEPAGVARKAIQALIDTLQFLGNAAIWIIIFLIPTLIVIFIPFFLVFLLIRAIVRRSKRKHPKITPNPEELSKPQQPLE